MEMYTEVDCDTQESRRNNNGKNDKKRMKNTKIEGCLRISFFGECELDI